LEEPPPILINVILAVVSRHTCLPAFQIYIYRGIRVPRCWCVDPIT
jgi:hypothetical protein